MDGEGRPRVSPMIYGRKGEDLYLHGHVSAGLLKNGSLQVPQMVEQRNSPTASFRLVTYYDSPRLGGPQGVLKVSVWETQRKLHILGLPGRDVGVLLHDLGRRSGAGPVGHAFQRFGSLRCRSSSLRCFWGLSKSDSDFLNEAFGFVLV